MCFKNTPVTQQSNEENRSATTFALLDQLIGCGGMVPGTIPILSHYYCISKGPFKHCIYSLLLREYNKIRSLKQNEKTCQHEVYDETYTIPRKGRVLLRLLNIFKKRVFLFYTSEWPSIWKQEHLTAVHALPYKLSFFKNIINSYKKSLTAIEKITNFFEKIINMVTRKNDSTVLFDQQKA